jgi:hypothetical protein
LQKRRPSLRRHRRNFLARGGPGISHLKYATREALILLGFPHVARLTVSETRAAAAAASFPPTDSGVQKNWGADLIQLPISNEGCDVSNHLIFGPVLECSRVLHEVVDRFGKLHVCMDRSIPLCWLPHGREKASEAKASCHGE